MYLCYFFIKSFQRCGAFLSLTYIIKHTVFFKQIHQKQHRYTAISDVSIIYVIESLTSYGYKQNEISQEQSMGTKIVKTSYYTVLKAFSFKKIKILTQVPL
jgi:LytS/YehU family sensor histidine kinase